MLCTLPIYATMSKRSRIDNLIGEIWSYNAIFGHQEQEIHDVT
jgi:hypothetical protein